ncbi:MAG: LbtU family siderophore porin [Deltaproteobacteria bacterium]|nr:LbtU family siderophore porin [Deltaproteobacteria bacterium]
MNTITWMMCVLMIGFCALSGPALAGEMTNDELMRELKAVKNRVQQLERMLKERGTGDPQEGPARDIPEFERIRSENERIGKELETVGKEQRDMRSMLEQVMDRVTINGIVEVEASYEKPGKKSGKNEESSDITLATAQIEFDARVHELVNAHLILLWEEDDTGPVDIDEGTITLGATPEMPWFLLAGKFYPPFSTFDTFFISDPLTLEIGEIRESAASVGYSGDWLFASFGGFNGDVSSEENDHINNLIVNVDFFNPEGTWSGFRLNTGVGFLFNMADTDTLQEETAVDTLKDAIPGVAAHATLGYGDFQLIAEYVTALSDFEAGELGFAVLDGEAREARPSAWNLELGYGFLEKFQLAARYEGSHRLYGLRPKFNVGGVFGWELYSGVTLSLEYLHGEFDENDEGLDSRDAFTTQLALEF